MPVTIVTETAQEFMTRHGTDYVCDQAWTYLQTGASIHRGTHERCEPPADPYERTRLVWYFWKLKAKQDREDFESLKQDMLNGTRINQHNGEPPFGPEALKRLTAARNAARSSAAKESTARQAMEDAEPSQARGLREQRARNRQANEALAEQILNVKL